MRTIQTRERETRERSDSPTTLLRASGRLFHNSGERSVARRSARTLSARPSARALRCADRDDRQMPSATVVLDVKDKPNTRLALHRNTRCGTGRTTWPSCPRLESRMPAPRMAIVVDFVRRPAIQKSVRTLFIEPFREEGQLSPEVSASRGHGDHASAFVLQSSDEPLDHRDTAVFSDGAEARLDARGLAPVLERRAPELATLVGHDVSRFAVLPYRPVEESLHCPGGRLRSVDHQSHDSPGVVVDNDRDPPARWPHLGQRERKPRRPEAAEDGNDGEVDVPKMVGILGLHDPFGRT